MKILRDHPLKALNTFGIEASATYFAEIHSIDEIREILSNEIAQKEDILVIGGGSNLLFTRDFDGLVIHNCIYGKKVISVDSNHVLLEVGAGENWHELVLFCIEKGYAGIENLSLIPGCVGAAPIQNIGAYGVELKDVFHSLKAMHLDTGKILEFTKEECKFDYRDSIFKRSLKGRVIIVSVTLKLNLNPEFHTDYGAIRDILAKEGDEPLSIKRVSDAVIAIRQSKLPDPAKIGNAGSFFKNPVISKGLFKKINKSFPNAPSYPIDEKDVKVPAGWLIEKCGWKGRRFGDAGVHSRQALVLVNHGNANGTEIAALAKCIQSSVLDKFGVQLYPEANIV